MDLSDPISAVIPSIDGRVLLSLARSGLPMTGHQVARLAGVSPEGARKVLLRLRDHGLVTTMRAGSAVMYAANRRHLMWPGIQQLVSDADRAVGSVKAIIGGTIDEVIGERGSSRVTAALYGSVARGESRADSDVDVLLVFPDEESAEVTDALVVAVIDTVQEATGNVCNVYAATRTEFDALVVRDDPMIASWAADAHVFRGPDFRRRLRGMPWDGR